MASKYPLVFSLELNPRWIVMSLLAIAPGIIYAIWQQNTLWLVAPLLAMCGILPYGGSYRSIWLALLNVILICSLAFLVKYLMELHSLPIMLLFIVCLALFAGFVDSADAQLKSFSSWLIIGSIYGGDRLVEYSLSELDVLKLIMLSFAGIILATIVKSRGLIKLEPKLPRVDEPEFILCFKYVLPMLCTTLLWFKLDLREPQWLIWSSLSVVFLEIDALYLRFQQRSISVILGCSSGLLVSHFLPVSEFITYLSLILLLLSLRGFKDYFPAYFSRCFLVVIYAGNHSLTIAYERFSNVILGGLIGFICTYCLIKVYELLAARMQRL
jgi:hypothetical protein